MGAQSFGIGGGGGGTRPLNRLISLALSDMLGFGNSLAVLWLPWAALVWAFIMASLALALGEREAKCTKRGGWRAARAQGWTVRSDAKPDGVQGYGYCSIDLRAPQSKLWSLLEPYTPLANYRAQKTP